MTPQNQEDREPEQLGQRKVNWPIRYTPLSPQEQSDHALLCVTAYYGGYCGLAAAFRKRKR
jgi:hypothetical protein